jgi:hypothetical protein
LIWRHNSVNGVYLLNGNRTLGYRSSPREHLTALGGHYPLSQELEGLFCVYNSLNAFLTNIMRYVHHLYRPLPYCITYGEIWRTERVTLQVVKEYMRETKSIESRCFHTGVVPELIKQLSSCPHPTGHRHHFNIFSTLVQFNFLEITWKHGWFNQCVPGRIGWQCPHRARMVTEWFDEHGNDVNNMPWPSQSPDLNPFEQL